MDWPGLLSRMSAGIAGYVAGLHRRYHVRLCLYRIHVPTKASTAHTVKHFQNVPTVKTSVALPGRRKRPEREGDDARTAPSPGEWRHAYRAGEGACASKVAPAPAMHREAKRVAVVGSGSKQIGWMPFLATHWGSEVRLR